MRVSRRDVLALPAAAPLLPKGKGRPARPKIAALCTVYFKHSHSQHIVDRFLEGYGWQGAHHRPPMDLVSLYVDQVGRNDLSRERLARFPSVKGYPTIAEALTLGTGRLAVDGILLIGEHGKYPKNEKGQTLYPRYEFFQEIVRVFRVSERTCPVFNDKHLSWSWERAADMVQTARDLDFPLLAGSSLPVTWRIPAVDLPYGAEVEEAVGVCYGGVDSYDYHGLELVQSMVERRKGGEQGVAWIEAVRGEAFWRALEEGRWSRELMNAALARSLTVTLPPPGPGESLEAWRAACKDPIGYLWQHTDGVRSAMLMLNGPVTDFTFAARVKGSSQPVSALFYLPMPPQRASMANFFSPLTNHVETLFLTGKPPYPIERTLMATGLTCEGVESVFRGGARIETPHLAELRYEAPRASTFWRL
jgi:hypothetical protein